MKVHVRVVDDNGTEFEGEVSLLPVRPGEGSAAVGPQTTVGVTPVPAAPIAVGSHPDFDLELRAFVKIYGKGMNGQQTFTLLAAKLAKGNPMVDVTRAEIEAAWSGAAGIIGGPFDVKSSTRAKDDGYLGSRGRGLYHLNKKWVEILPKPLRLAE